MSFKNKLVFFSAFLALGLFAIFLLVSCGVPSSDVPEEYNCKIVYLGNGGKFDKYDSQTVYVKSGQYLPLPLENGTLKMPTNAGYYLMCWKFASYDSNEELIISDETVDFNSYKVTEDVMIAPVWEECYTVLIYDTDDISDDTDANAIKYTVTPGSDGIQMPSTNLPKKSGYTFLRNYLFSNKDVAEEEQRLVSFPLDYEDLEKFDQDGDKIVSLYPVFKQNHDEEFDWTLVYSWEDFMSGAYFLLMNDIDFSSMPMYDWMSSVFKMKGCIIDGNGYSITGNLNLEYKKDCKNGYSFLPNTGITSIENLTFKNCTCTVDLKNMLSASEVHVAFLIASGNDLSLNQVCFENCLLKIENRSTPHTYLLYGGDGLKIDGKPVDPPSAYEGITISLPD